MATSRTLAAFTHSQHDLVSKSIFNPYNMTDAHSNVLEDARQQVKRLDQYTKSLKANGVKSPEWKVTLDRAVAKYGVKKEAPEDTARVGDQGKSDSEAETVVPEGKGETVSPEKRKIEHKKSGTEASKLRRDTATDLLPQGSPRDGTRALSLKRKRPEPSLDRRDTPDGANSSLSSRYSSPIHETTSSKRSIATSERSRSSPPYDEAVQEKVAKPKKRRHRPSEDAGAASRGKCDPDARSDKRPRKQRDVRSATHDEFSTHRSESPQLPQQIRAQSSQADIQGTVRKRKPTLALHVEHRRKVSDDPGAFSDDARSARDLPPLRTANSIDQQIMSARAPHRKNRDKSGRTLLAKACNGDLDEAEARLRDRPEDIDVADYAGNTPLQIASLAGCEDIVRLLIKEGCDIHCKNVDSDTPLIDAVENGHLEVVKVLLDAGVDPRQGNKTGAEPLELLGEQHDDYDAIRDALVAATKRDTRRRQSRDQSTRAHDDQSTSAGSPTDQTPMSALAGEHAGRRKTARSQPTRGDTLYTHATPERLREAAAKGDAQVVVQILEMGLLHVDSESMIAATKGGHDEVLSYLIAMGQPDPDPDPIRTGSGNEAYSTPVLAAIGRKNLKPLDLLISQPGFDPTRRLLKGKAYHELAEDRQGPNWQEEREMLLKAYEQWKGQKASNVHDSPRKIKWRKAIDTSPSLNAHRTSDKNSLLTDNESRALVPETKKVKAPLPGDHTGLANASDAESDVDKLPVHKQNRSHSIVDASKETKVLQNADSNKPKRRLMSKNEIESSQEQRRASLATESSTGRDREKSRKISGAASTREHRDKSRQVSGPLDSKDSMTKPMRTELPNSTAPSGKPKHKDSSVLKGSLDSSTHSSTEAMASKGPTIKPDHPSSPKKRPRLSDSPKRSRDSDPLIKKRRRTDSQTSADVSSRPPASMMPNASSKSATPTQSKPEAQSKPAPVAFMGNTPGSFESAAMSPSSQKEIYRQDLQAQKHADEVALQRERAEETKEIVSNAVEKEDPNPFAAAGGQSSARQEKEIQAVNATACKEAELAPTKDAAKEEARRQAKLAEEQLQRERTERERLEVEEAKARKEAEEKKRQEEQAAADELEAQHKKDLEVARRREAEQEAQRIAQEKQAEQDRERARQRDLEAQLEQQRQRQAAEERALAEHRRLKSLPDAFQHAATIPFPARTCHQQIADYLPLKAGKMRNMYPSDCPEEVADDLWICNLQAALVLGSSDVELRACTLTLSPLEMSHLY